MKLPRRVQKKKRILGQSSLQTLTVKDWAEDEARDTPETGGKQGESGIMKAAEESISERRGGKCAQSCQKRTRGEKE